jgi:hypothetical protein
MSVKIEIPEMPDDVYARLKVRADKAGVSFPDYLSRELSRIAELASIEEALERLRSDPPTNLSESPTDVIRAWRDAI